jgi:hypothetical protein
MADIDVKLECPERLVFNETLQRCDWPESTVCKSGNLLVEDDDTNHGFCADKVISKNKIELKSIKNFFLLA